MMRTYLGQNFLVDRGWQEKIVSYFNPPAKFMEIGPGRGALTQHLSKKYSDFYVLEKDRELVEIHRKSKNYQTISADFMDWDFSLEGKPVENFSFIGNLPYESGSGMLQKIAERADQISTFVFLLQKEVIERICAKPRTRDFASFTVLIQGQFDVEALDIIPPECFSPPPKVFSQLVHGQRRKEGLHPQTEEYRKFLRQSFLHKRKTFRNALKSVFDQNKIDDVLSKFELIPTCRAEEIEVGLWPKLYEEFYK